MSTGNASARKALARAAARRKSLVRQAQTLPVASGRRTWRSATIAAVCGAFLTGGVLIFTPWGQSVAALAVFDSSNLAQNAATAARAASMLANMGKQLERMTNMEDTLGIKKGIDLVGDLGGILRRGQSMIDGLGPVSRQRDVAAAVDAITDIASMTGAGGTGSADTFASAQRLVQGMRIPKNITDVELGSILRGKARIARNATEDAYAYAIYARNVAATSEDRINGVRQQLGSEMDLQDRITVLTQAILNLTSETAVQTGLMATYVHMMSANGVASDPREAAIGADQLNTGDPNGNDQNQEGIRSGDLWTNPDAH